MSSPRKFAEKIALLQQKQAEDDAAFQTIIHEVGAAKQKSDRSLASKRNLDVPKRKYDTINGMNHSDSHNSVNRPIKSENNQDFEQLLLPPSDNSSWRRTHSDSSLHHAMIPAVRAHYQAQLDNQDQQMSYDMNYDPPSHDNHHLQVLNSHFPTPHPYDVNNNHPQPQQQTYSNGQTNILYSPKQSIIPQQTNFTSSQTTTNTHTLLGGRYSSGSTNSNVLMLPPNHYPRGGGSLPDLRVGSAYNDQQLFFPSAPPPSASISQQQFFRSPSPQQTSNGDFFVMDSQRQLPSSIGPLKQSPSMRRRHSPIGEVRQGSPRRQKSPSPDVSSTHQNSYRGEPQSPSSQSTYSPQSSPHLLQSPKNELSPYSPQQQSNDNPQPYFTLPNHFDQITLDNNFYTQQQQQPSSPSAQQRQNHSLPTTPDVSNDFQQELFYPLFADDQRSSYAHNHPPINRPTNFNVKSATIPNIILTDVDSSKLDLLKELTADYSNPFDSLIDMNDLQLNTDDFFLDVGDPSLRDGDDAFLMLNR